MKARSTDRATEHTGEEGTERAVREFTGSIYEGSDECRERSATEEEGRSIFKRVKGLF